MKSVSQAREKLAALAEDLQRASLRELFAADPGRLRRFSFGSGALFFDYSKNLVSEDLLETFREYLEALEFEDWREKLWSGDELNHTEKRAVLHVALRNYGKHDFRVDGKSVNADIVREFGKMESFVRRVYEGSRRGFSGSKFDTVVNIGIGGSDLGPRMVCRALNQFGETPGLQLVFVANIDPEEINSLLVRLDPEKTLFIVTSKTFTTEETMTNANTLRDWLIGHYGDPRSVASHFIAVSTALDRVKAFGIDPGDTFGFWDWVGGRFSLSSAVGLSIMLAVGPGNFFRLLEGMAETDDHFRHAPLEKNMPLLMGVLAYWYRNYFDCGSYAILPYCNSLSFFPDYLQQLIMESNGKSVDRQGERITQKSSAAIWGGVGTNSQHSFFQLLHQGSETVPADLITAWKQQRDRGEHHGRLLANFFAQSEALAFGLTGEELQAGGCPGELIPYRTFHGNRFHNLIIMEELTPFSLGSLIAAYEHRVFTEGILLNINSFDQWGVELGKKIAGGIFRHFSSGEPLARSETAQLLEILRSQW